MGLHAADSSTNFSRVLPITATLLKWQKYLIRISLDNSNRFLVAVTFTAVMTSLSVFSAAQ
jgi:hypothetical protein